MNVTEIKIEQWKYPPTVSKSGRYRGPFDIKELIHMESDVFGHPVILMSDLHQHAMDVVKRLDSVIDLSEYVVLTVGDMAGKGVFGSNGDPTPTYEFLNNRSKRFYFVQGNHDLPAPRNTHMDLKNDDGTKCMLPDEKQVHTILGGMAGINGIITRSSKSRLYKFQPDEYYKLATNALSKGNVKVFLTHETPAIPISSDNGQEYSDKVRKFMPERRVLNGKSEFFELVNKFRPKVHVFGHCHHRIYTHLINGVRYFNVDSRVVIVNPED